MSAYTTLGSVRGRLPVKQSLNNQDDNPPSADTVTDWITKDSGELDVAFSNAGVALPITDTAVLAKLDTRLSREEAYQVMAVRAAAKSEKVEPLYFGWHQEYKDLFKEIAAGEVVAPGAGGNLGFSYTQGSVAGVTSADPSIDPKTNVDTRY